MQKYLKDPESEPALRVNVVVPERAERHLPGAVVGAVAGPVWVFVHPVPEAEVCAARCVVTHYSVVGVGDPDGCRGDVIILQTRALSYIDRQVVGDGVPRLYTILNKQYTSNLNPHLLMHFSH